MLTRESYYAFAPAVLKNLTSLVESVLEGWNRKKGAVKEALRNRFFPYKLLISEDHKEGILLNRYDLPLGMEPTAEDVDLYAFMWNPITDFNTLTGDFCYRVGVNGELSYVQLYNEEVVKPEKNKITMKRYLLSISKLEDILGGVFEVNVFDEPRPSLPSFNVLAGLEPAPVEDVAE